MLIVMCAIFMYCSILEKASVNRDEWEAKTLSDSECTACMQ